MSFLSNQPYKGTRDFFPEEMRFRRWMLGTLTSVVKRFGFEEYDGPMLEPFELYAAKTGDEIVNQQLYHLIDRGDRKVAIRPEMTPTLARMVSSKVRELPRPIRWYSIPNLWRYERPQKGRLREFWQLNVDILGGDSLLADAEILTIAVELMRAFQGESKIKVCVNHRNLIDTFFNEYLKLDATQAGKLMKAVDARSKIGEEGYQKLIGELNLSQLQTEEIDTFFKLSLEQITAKYDCKGSRELTQIFSYLKESGVTEQVVFDASIFRGLDYYTGTVFEIYDISPENRRAMFGGGRYDNLIGLFGKEQLSGVGFGMGDVTLQNFLEIHSLAVKPEPEIDVLMGMPSAEMRATAEKISRELREVGFSVVSPLGFSGFGNHLKTASKLGARFTLLFGESEWKEQKLILKEMKTGEQKVIALAELKHALAKK